MEANLKLNRLDNVKTFKVALGGHVGEAALAVAEPAYGGMNAIDAGRRGADWTESTEPIPIETIDALVDRSGLHRLDFIRLDIEGSEVDALEGGRASIARFQPPILLEAEEDRLANQSRTKADLIRVLDEFGYELWVFDGASAQLRHAELRSEPERNTVAAPRGWRPPVLV